MNRFSKSALLSLLLLAGASTLPSALATPYQLRQPTMRLPNVWTAGVSGTGRTGGTVQDFAALGGYLGLQLMSGGLQVDTLGPITGLIADVSGLMQIGINPEHLYLYFRSRIGMGNVFGDARDGAFYLPVLVVMDTSTGNGSGRSRVGIRLEPAYMAVSSDGAGNITGVTLSLVTGVSLAQSTEMSLGAANTEVVGGVRGRGWHSLANGYQYGYEVEATLGHILETGAQTAQFDAFSYFRFPSGWTVNAGFQFMSDGDRQEIVPMVGVGGNIER